MVIKIGRFGKFLACPGFPECTNTKALSEDTGATCPVCGAKVVKKKSARGYVYFSCDTYPTCQFITWDKPLQTKCPVCDSSLFRHTDRDSKEITDVCLRVGCDYKELVREGLSPEETEKNRKRREERAAKAEPLPWMTKTTGKFKKLKDEAVEALTDSQKEAYQKALAQYEAEKAAEKQAKAAEKLAEKKAAQTPWLTKTGKFKKLKKADVEALSAAKQKAYEKARLANEAQKETRV
jgi:DNA topoisomerase-1